MIELFFGVIVAIFVFCIVIPFLYVIFIRLPIMAIGGIIGKIADARDRRTVARRATQ